MGLDKISSGTTSLPISSFEKFSRCLGLYIIFRIIFIYFNNLRFCILFYFFPCPFHLFYLLALICVMIKSISCKHKQTSAFYFCKQLFQDKDFHHRNFRKGKLVAFLKRKMRKSYKNHNHSKKPKFLKNTLRKILQNKFTLSMIFRLPIKYCSQIFQSNVSRWEKSS